MDSDPCTRLNEQRLHQPPGDEGGEGASHLCLVARRQNGKEL